VRLLRLLGLGLLLATAQGARADDIGPAQAQALQQQLKDWLSGLFGPSVQFPEWRITGEGDHYVLTWPIPGLTGAKGEVATTARLRPLDAGRWSIDSMTLPPSGEFTMPVPDADAQGQTTPMTMRFSIAQQDTHGVIDPAFATASTLHGELGNARLAAETAKQRQEQQIDHYVAETRITPAEGGRLDVVSEATATGWKSASQANGSPAMAIGIQSLKAALRIDRVNREQVAAMMTASRALMAALPPDLANTKELPEPAREPIRQLIGSLQDMLSAISLEETLEGLQTEVPGMGGLSVKRFLLGLGGEAPDGRLHAWLNIGLDELASPSLPPKVATYLPHHFELKPSVSGVLVSDLRKLALDATQEGADTDSLMPDIAAIFSHGGVNVGLETLAFDLGPAKVQGTGKLTVLAPDSWHGEAHVVASGLDDLTNQARGNPDLQQALPALIMLRGLGKPEANGKRLVWDIVSDGPSVTVNGLDLSQLGGSGGKPAAKPPGQAPRR